MGQGKSTQSCVSSNGRNTNISRDRHHLRVQGKSSDNNTSCEKIAHESKEDAENELEKQNKELKDLVEKTKASMKQDKSTANLFYNYGLLRKAASPNLGAVKDSVTLMKEGWNGIMSQLEKIKTFGEEGKTIAKKMKDLYFDYWKLLLKTNEQLGKLLPQAEIQKQCIDILSGIVEKCEKKDGSTTLSKDDQLAFDDCLGMLRQWIDTTIIASLIEDWNKISTRIQDIQHEWEPLEERFAQEAAKEAAKDASRETGIFIGKIIVGTIIVVGVIAIVATVTILTAGVGTAAAGAGAAAVVAAETTAAISTSAVVGIAVGVGAAAIAASGVYAYVGVKNINKETVKIRNDIYEITNDLQKMLDSSSTVQSALSDVQKKHNKSGTGLKWLENSQSNKMMKIALKSLDASLDDFIKEGEAAEQKIADAINEFLKKRS